MVWSERMQPRGCSGQRRALFICTFAPDQPLMELLEAARRLPDVTVQITGDLRRLPARAKAAAADNVEWLGYLVGDKYVSALTGADVLLALTLRAESVQRSAHEAIDALRPLVLSEWPHMRDLFPYASSSRTTRTASPPASRTRYAAATSSARPRPAARAVQHRRWSEQLGELRWRWGGVKTEQVSTPGSLHQCDVGTQLLHSECTHARVAGTLGGSCVHTRPLFRGECAEVTRICALNAHSPRTAGGL